MNVNHNELILSSVAGAELSAEELQVDFDLFNQGQVLGLGLTMSIQRMDKNITRAIAAEQRNYCYDAPISDECRNLCRFVLAMGQCAATRGAVKGWMEDQEAKLEWLRQQTTPAPRPRIFMHGVPVHTS